MSTIVDENNFLVKNLKALLQEKLWLLEERLKHKRLQGAYVLTDAQARVLATLRGESLTISEVARRLGVSRQAVHKLVSELVKEGLLALEITSDNARDKQIVFTEKGEALKRVAGKALLEIELEIQEALGPSDFKLLKQLLAKDW